METGMIIKSVIAGLTLGGAAFGGVYYGLPSTTPDGAVKPSDMARLEPATPQTQDRHSEDVKVAELHPHPEKKTPKKVKDDSEEADEPETKWIDNYLKKAEPEDEDISDEDMPDTDETDTDMAESDAEDEGESVNLKEIINRVKTDIKDGPDKTSEPEAVVKADKDTGKFVVETPSNSETLGIVLREASMITSDDLKDQAHMDIIDYALRMGNYDSAKDTIDLINQPELRETARSRVAVSYAKDGQADDAFDMIDSVEMADFADVMRLQVIEALTHPKDMSDIPK